MENDRFFFRCCCWVVLFLGLNGTSSINEWSNALLCADGFALSNNIFSSQLLLSCARFFSVAALDTSPGIKRAITKDSIVLEDSLPRLAIFCAFLHASSYVNRNIIWRRLWHVMRCNNSRWYWRSTRFTLPPRANCKRSRNIKMCLQCAVLHKWLNELVAQLSSNCSEQSVSATPSRVAMRKRFLEVWRIFLEIAKLTFESSEWINLEMDS